MTKRNSRKFLPYALRHFVAIAGIVLLILFGVSMWYIGASVAFAGPKEGDSGAALFFGTIFFFSIGYVGVVPTAKLAALHLVASNWFLKPHCLEFALRGLAKRCEHASQRCVAAQQELISEAETSAATLAARYETMQDDFRKTQKDFYHALWLAQKLHPNNFRHLFSFKQLIDTDK